MIQARACILATVLLHALPFAALAQPSRPETPASSTVQDRIVPLEATVNGAKAGGWPFVERAGRLHVGPDALEEWRVRIPPDVNPIRVRGLDFIPLDAIPGFDAKLNFGALTAEITFSPDAFMGSRLVLASESTRPQPSPVLPSLFLNYDLNFQRSASGGVSSQDLGALLELGASTRWGVLTSSHVGRNLTGGSLGLRKEWLRLESTVTRHFPQSNLSLRLGDSVTRAGLWGRQVYFGGIQFGTNFSLSPGLLTQPLPLLRGVSSAPSTVELYVNDVLRKVSQVPTGPFVIDDSQGLTGSGEARLVVRDVLGREVVILQPFFSTVELLAPGLNDWSVELGAVRENLGVTNGDYGDRFVTGTWRRGISEQWTGEGRAEWSRVHQAAGAGAVAALPGDVLARAAIAASRHDRVGAGRLALLGLERQWVRTALTLQWQLASSRYRELGMADQPAVRRQLAASLSQQWGASTVALGLARIERHDGPPLTTVSLNHGMRLGEAASLNLYLTRALGQAGGTSLGMMLQLPLEKQRHASAAFSSHGGVHDAYASVARYPGEDGDLGWRVLGGRLNGGAHAEAGLDYTGRYGSVYSDLSASPRQHSLRLGASGGMAMAARRVFFSRRLDQSFAVAELRGYPGIGVGLGSTPTTVTDAAGIAFIPSLSAYQANQVRLDAKDLPISAELDSIEQIVVPSWRSAVKVDFPVRSGRAALVTIRQEDGEPLPAGAVVWLQGDQQEFFVGRRGESFVTGLKDRNVLQARWKDRSCSFTLALPPARDDIPRVGPLTCRTAP